MRAIRPILDPQSLVISDETTLKCEKCGFVEVLTKRRLGIVYNATITIETSGTPKTYCYKDICSNCIQELLNWLRTPRPVVPTEEVTDADIIDAI